jgi:hypothetical protein
MVTPHSNNSNSKSSSISKGKVAAAIGAAAAAATAGVAAYKTFSGSKPTVYEVKPHDDGWQLIKEGAGQATSVHGTKEQATAAGREFAGSHVPSQLKIYKADGSHDVTHSYGPEAG